MYEDILEGIGLTKSEISVYFALLDLGSSTTGPIIKRAQIASGKAYLILDKLLLKGLVTQSIKSGTKYYRAKDPMRLLDYLKEKEILLKEKEDQLRKIIPVLKEKYESKKEESFAEVYEGINGFKTFHKLMLDKMKKGETIYVFGAPKEANEKFGAYYVEWNNQRVKKGIKLKILYNSDSREYGEVRKLLPLTEVRYMKKELETPAWIDIFRDYVVTINVHGTPVCFLIKNKESAESYEKYFDVLWKQAKK